MTGDGQLLSESAHAFFAPRFGQDFSHVRIHTDGHAVETARAVNARAYTLGRHIVFNAGEYQPNTDAGRRLLAHELTHVVQQRGGAALQRQPNAPDPDAAREAALKEAEAAACTTEQIEAQSDAEDKLKLKWRRRKDKNYAWALGRQDKTRLQKSTALSAQLQQEISVKVRFFRGEAKAAYLRMITPVVSELAESEQIAEILAECATATKQTKQERPDIPCDISKYEFLFEDEADPANTRCMDINTDPEFDTLFDRNIKRGVGYAVPGTTWANVDYDSFNVIVVEYHNGKSEYFMLDSVGNFTYPSSRQVSSSRDFKFVKRATGFIYPVFEDQIYLRPQLTPRIVSLKNGLKYQTKELKDLYKLLEVGGSFAAILGLYGLGVESFKASIYAFRRGGPVKLPGRPLPGIGVKPAAARQAFVDSVFSELGGPKRGFTIQIVDDSTVIETPTSRWNLGLATANQKGALTDVGARRIYVHQSLVDANGLVRDWGAALDLKQVTAHELGHGINGGGPCAMASRTGADLPGLSAAQRAGLLDDAVHISRSSRTPDERLRLEDLHLPKDYEPPKP
jgi:hypothetical protein